MNRQTSFLRKVFYLVAMGALLMPLYWLSHPATSERGLTKAGSGGKLARLREEYQISQTQLGEIDPTSETIKLATLGMRGIAADVLWWKANTYQMKKDWNNLRVTLEQISKLQPHFIAVWRHQAWNLSYNVSVSFDDYHDKYYWVIEGIKFLQQGVKYNERESRLLWDLGWFIAQKIGRADEKVQYRRLFANDEDFYKAADQRFYPGGSRPPELRDNWLVGKDWFRAAEELVDTLQIPPRGMAPVIFFSDGPMCQMNYAEAIEKDGHFDEVARRAWKGAADDWHSFGDRPIPSTFDVEIRLNDQEKLEALAAQQAAALEKLGPGMREKIAAEKRESLKPKERKALDTPADKRTSEQQSLASDAETKLRVSHEELGRRIGSDEAKQLAREATENEQTAVFIRRDREKVNFDYWRMRADSEQTAPALAARKAFFEGNRAFAQADLVKAKASYEAGFQAWKTLFEKFPALKEDRATGDDVLDAVRQYRRVLEQDDKPFPKPFILQEILDKHGKQKD